MDAQDACIRGMFLIRDRDAKYSALIDEILAEPASAPSSQAYTTPA
jgi:hypothetical protein